jgi:hypothetical protein
MLRRIAGAESGIRKSAGRAGYKPLCLPALMLLSWWWLQTPALAATKVFLKSASSQLKPPAGWDFRLASTTQGSSSQGCTTNSVAGPVTGQYFPGNATGHLATCAGAKLAWFTPPLASGVTIAGTITPNLWGLESATQCNCGLRYEVLRWDVRQGGIVSSLGMSADNGLTEWGTSAAVRTAPALAPSSTGFNAGDRIVIVIYNDDASGTTQASGRNWTLNHDGPAGANGDTYLSFTETLSFSSDSNNARPQGIFSLLLEPLAWWKEFFDQAFA